MTVGSGGGATLQFSIAGTNNALLKPTTLTLSGTTTINITKCPYALTNFPLVTGYTAGTLVLGSQPTGWTGQLTVSGGTVYYTATSLDPNLKPFVHPGCLSTLADLQRMKAKVQAGRSRGRQPMLLWPITATRRITMWRIRIPIPVVAIRAPRKTT